MGKVKGLGKQKGKKKQLIQFNSALGGEHMCMWSMKNSTEHREEHSLRQQINSELTVNVFGYGITA